MFASFCFHAYYLDGRGQWQLLSCPVGLHGQFLPSQPIPRFFPPFLLSFFLWRPLVQMAPLVVWLVVGAVALIQPSSIKFWGGQRLRSHKDVCFWSLTCEAVQWTSVIRGFVWKVMPAFFFLLWPDTSEVGAILVDVAAEPSKKYSMSLMAADMQCY